MENRINKIMTLVDGSKYFILKQAIYKNENYYAVIGIADNEEDLLDDHAILHELERDGQVGVEEVTDVETLKIITQYLGIISEEEWKNLVEEQK